MAGPRSVLLPGSSPICMPWHRGRCQWVRFRPFYLPGSTPQNNPSATSEKLCGVMERPMPGHQESCVALGKSLTFSGVCFSHCNSGWLDRGSFPPEGIKASLSSSQSSGYACLPWAFCRSIPAPAHPYSTFPKDHFSFPLLRQAVFVVCGIQPQPSSR